MIRPYPTVRISGSLTKAGADVALLTVKAPKGVRITLTCEGKSCPLREVAQATGALPHPAVRARAARRDEADDHGDQARLHHQGHDDHDPQGQGPRSHRPLPAAGRDEADRLP